MVDTKITTFSEEYADTAVAKKALHLSKRQATLTNNKKKRGGSKKRIHDVDEFAG
jgi:hypothetical protein